MREAMRRGTGRSEREAELERQNERLFAPIVEVRAVFCGSGCLAFETPSDVDLRLETGSGEAVPARHDDRITRFDLGARTGDVSLSWRSHSFDPGVVLEFGGCDADGPPAGLRVRKNSSSRATLEATIGFDGAEPFLTARLPSGARREAHGESTRRLRSRSG